MYGSESRYTRRKHNEWADTRICTKNMHRYAQMGLPPKAEIEKKISRA